VPESEKPSALDPNQLTFKGKSLESMSKEELVEVIAYLLHALNEQQVRRVKERESERERLLRSIT
jgi:hypothetical protein